jgi:hypothetical protein
LGDEAPIGVNLRKAEFPCRGSVGRSIPVRKHGHRDSIKVKIPEKHEGKGSDKCLETAREKKAIPIYVTPITRRAESL